MSMVNRRIDVTITLGTGSFGSTIGQTITLTNHRILCEMQTRGGDSKGEIMMAIYGLPLSIMNQLTTIGPVMTSIRDANAITVSAGDDGQALTQIFKGTIDTAFADFNNAPETPLQIHGLSALVAAVKPVEPTSVKGAADVVLMMIMLAEKMGLTLENNGVNATIQNPYLSGTAYQQMRSLAKAAGISAFVEGDKLVIMPKDGHRAGNVPIVSKNTGMIGYPTFSSSGMVLRTLFHPDIKLGGQINVKSELQVANGIWNVYGVSHKLDALKPGGLWETIITCYRAST